MPFDLKIAFYRIAQESINNAIQHASASHADVTLTVDLHQVTLKVVDNGRGFKPLAKNLGHMGLRIMRERAEGIGATLDINSVTGEGTAITVTWLSGENNT
jgi:signal transduction histidine kinase